MNTITHPPKEHRHMADNTTVEISAGDRTSGPIPFDEFGERMEAATARIRRQQLSFDVGGAAPDAATLKIAGELRLGAGLRKGTGLHLKVVTDDGEVIAAGDAYVVAVTFKDKRDKYGEIESTERSHTAALL